jgi:dipeptidyl aminopeptidase/acylaminoacyl peptidase
MHRRGHAMTDPIARLRGLGIILTVLSIPIGCSSVTSADSDSVDVFFTVITVGEELDPDGYTIVIGDAPGLALPTTGEARVPGLSVGNHSFEILGIAANCRLTNAPTSGSLDTRRGTTVDLIVFCLQPEPGLIIYATIFQSMHIRNALGGDPETLTLLGNSVSATQDGERIAFELDGDIWVANIDASDPVNLSNTPDSVEGQPSWSWDGTRILYDLQADSGQGASDVFVMNEDGSGATNLTPDTPDWNDGKPAWSPDGTRVAFGSDRTGAGDLYTMAVDGSDLVRLTDGVMDTNPRWSPDGQRIVFTRFLDPAEGGTDFELFVINTDGTGLTQLTDNGFFRTTHADWSPDGQWMVVASLDLTLGLSDLYMMRSDGTDLIRLTFSEGAGFSRWIP